jgi:hypothetical protein
MTTEITISLTIQERPDGSAHVFMGEQYLGRLDPIAQPVDPLSYFKKPVLWEATDSNDISKPELFDFRRQAALALAG